MYDKDLMPVVDELYLNDQSHQLLSMKQDGKQSELHAVFESFIEDVETSICQIMGDPEFCDPNAMAIKGQADVKMESSKALLGQDFEEEQEVLDVDNMDEVVEAFENEDYDEEMAVEEAKQTRMKTEDRINMIEELHANEEQVYSEVILFVDNREKRNQ